MLKRDVVFLPIALLSLLALLIVGCGKAAVPVDDNELAYIAAPNQDGFAGNSRVEYLGKKIDAQSGLEVEGWAIIHYAPGFAPPDRTVSVKPPKPPKDEDPPEAACYEFIYTGLRWRTVESWQVDVANAPESIRSGAWSVIDSAISEWEVAAGTQILGYGDGQLGAGPGLDGRNCIYFGDYPEAGVIAVNYLWGSTLGPPKKREITEYDELYDVVDFQWSLTGEAGKMDFENIAQHELGHACGLADLYTADCNLETMFGYASTGQTIKRDLNAGDIAGIKALYK